MEMGGVEAWRANIYSIRNTYYIWSIRIMNEQDTTRPHLAVQPRPNSPRIHPVASFTSFIALQQFCLDCYVIKCKYNILLVYFVL